MKKRTTVKRVSKKAEMPLAHRRSNLKEALLVQGLLLLVFVILAFMLGYAKTEGQSEMLALGWAGIGILMLLNDRRIKF